MKLLASCQEIEDTSEGKRNTRLRKGPVAGRPTPETSRTQVADADEPRAGRLSAPVALAALLVALAVLGVSILILVSTTRPAAVDAGFTRVGGATRVETSADAARFWLRTPKYFVTVASTAQPPTVLHAANCAIANHAPLLFTPGASPVVLLSKSTTRNPALNALLASWRPTPTELAVSNSQYQVVWNRRVLTDHHGYDCPLSTRWPRQMWTLAQNAQLLPSGYAENRRNDLAEFVVFASSVSALPDYRKPSPAEQPDSPDVAVGLALAAYMAPETMGGVSVVVVPHNLEADPGLETDLRSEHSAVLGGVVLGGPDRISEDTRDLLRQILRQPERAAILEAVHSSLGDVGAILAAALALIGALAVAKTTVPVIADSTIATLHSGFDTVRRQIEREQVTLAGTKINKDGPVTTDGGSETHAERKGSSTGLSPHPEAFVDAPMFIRLRTGRTVKGIYEGIDTLGTVSFIRLREAEDLGPSGPGEDPAVRHESADAMLIPVEQVELATKVTPQSGSQ